MHSLKAGANQIAPAFLHEESPVAMSGMLDFENTNAFFYEIRPSQSSKGYIECTGDSFNNFNKREKDYSKWHRSVWDRAVEESALKDSQKFRAFYLKKYLSSFTVYHFHDTSSVSPMRGDCNLRRYCFLIIKDLSIISLTNAQNRQRL